MNISEYTTPQALKQVGYTNRRPYRVSLLSLKNRRRRLQFTQAHQKTGKNVDWCDESRFLLQRLDGRVKIRGKQHKSMNPSYLVSKVWGGGGGVIVCQIFSWYTLCLLSTYRVHLVFRMLLPAG